MRVARLTASKWSSMVFDQIITGRSGLSTSPRLLLDQTMLNGAAIYLES